MRTTKLVLVMLFNIIIASCGGGGGGGSTPPPATYNISGAVSGATLAGVSISLTGAATTSGTTDAGGNYSFATLANGSYTVTPSKTGYTFNPSSTAVSVSGANVSGTNFTATANVASTYTLNDTGITAGQCYQAYSIAGNDNLVACNDSNATALNSAQDGMVGRDANVATNNGTDGKLGFNFTSVVGGCVQDNVTGLMWEVKTADGGLRDWTKTYTNYYNSTTALQKLTLVDGSDVYVAVTQAEIDAATNSLTFTNSVNTQGLCGYSDWRLPTPDELQSIVDYGAASTGPTIDTTWFPNTNGTPLSPFWSATPYVGSEWAWLGDFSRGEVSNLGARSSSWYIRLVRGGQTPPSARYSVSTDGQEVTDNQTNLIWRRCAEGMLFSGGTCTGSAPRYTHEAALQLAEAQASSTGIAWRLPNVKELFSIVDKSRFNPSIDPMAFPATPDYSFWSTSPYVGKSVGSATYAWHVSFRYGSVAWDNRTISVNYAPYLIGNGSVRLVRGGL